MSSIQNIQETMNEFSLEELLSIIAAATAAAKKKAKIVEKAPKEAKEKKGSMPKGELPPQLQKPFAWVDYTLTHANENGWPSYKVKGQEEKAEASELREGVHVFPSTGKPLNRKQAMSLSKYYWSAKEKAGENQALYEEFDAQHVPTAPKVVVYESDSEEASSSSAAAPKPKKEKAAPKPKKTEEEKEAEKEAKLAAKEAKKAADKEAKKAAAEAKKAPKSAASPSAPAAAVEEVGLDVPKKKAKKPATEAVVDTWVPKTTDGKVYPRTIGGVVYFSNHLHQLWTKDEDGGVGDWAGVFLVSENRVDASAADPFGDDE
jgi:membrane protein involved in colicin uptake